MAAPNAIATVALHEYIVNVRRPGFIFFTLFIPALGLIGLLLAGFFSGQAAAMLESQFSQVSRPAGVVDHTGLFTPIPADFSDRLTAMPDEAAARQALLAEDISSYAVIPSDYLASGQVDVYARGSFFENIATVDSSTLRPFLVQGLLRGQIDDALLRRVANPASINTISLDETGQPTSGGDIGSVVAGFIIPFVLSIFLIISIFSSSGYLLQGVSEEKESRVIEIVLSSVSASQLLAGKVLGLGALGLTQVLVWLLSAFFLSGGLGAIAAGVVVALNPGIFALSTLYFLLGFLLFGTLMAAAGALGGSSQESQQLGGIFSFAAAVPLMFTSLILASPNSAMVRALSYFPLTAPTVMMLRLPLTSVPPIDIALSLGVLAISIPLTIWAGAKVFRLGLLMYGKRPSLRQLWRLLRHA